jgi:peptidoglycan/LPS O-acetylase OafA/YrhL
VSAGWLSARGFRARFGRRTSSGRFIPEIDGLRFPAIAFVVVGHLVAFVAGVPSAAASRTATGRVLTGVAAHAGEGVLLFFIISGFKLFARHFHVVPGTENAAELTRHFLLSAAYLHNLI